jgi:hypothetical protein
MLITKIFVNEKQIDEIWISSTGEFRKGIYTYDIVKPELPEPEREIIHERAKGYESLLIQALSRVELVRLRPVQKQGGVEPDGKSCLDEAR